jgi:hypothetical protein
VADQPCSTKEESSTLQTHNGAMAIPVRTYNLNFPSLAPSTVSSNAGFPSGSSPALGFTGAKAGTSYAGAGTTMRPQGTSQTNAPAAQQSMVNSKAAADTPYSGVIHASMKMPDTETITARSSAAVKPIPATTTTKVTTQPKKTATADTTTTTSK